MAYRTALDRAIEDMSIVIDCTGPEIQVAFGPEDAIEHVAYDCAIGMFIWTGDRSRDVVVLNPPAPVNHKPHNLRWAYA